MFRIGLLDENLYNWHTMHYPHYLQLAAKLYGYDIVVAAACATKADESESKRWCEDGILSDAGETDCMQRWYHGNGSR